MGLRADLDLAAPAAVRRPHHRARSPPSAGHDPIDTLCDYLVDDKGATRVLVTSISEDDIERHRRARRRRWSAPTAIASRPTAPSSQGMPHPRFYGTFPRIIDHYVRERGVLPLRARDPQDDRRDRARAQAQGPRAAARKAIAPTSRSSIRRISATAPPTPTRTSIPTGARTTVIVNGTLVVENATHTGALPGKVLRGKASDGAVG